MNPLPIAFQGVAGAYSDLACRRHFPNYTTLPCETFEAAFQAVCLGKAGKAIIPIENSVAGRVADVHHFIPNAGLYITEELFQPVRHHLLAIPEAQIDSIRTIHSHIHALPQCRRLIEELGATPVIATDTAGAARYIADLRDPTAAALASSLAGEIYGLKTLRAEVGDSNRNVTRFLVMAREPAQPTPGTMLCITSFVFRVRSVPAVLYKALGGFATNGVNITKLESYIVDADFSQAQFYADIEGHPEDMMVQLALEELNFFSESVTMLGVYPAHPFRRGHPEE